MAFNRAEGGVTGLMERSTAGFRRHGLLNSVRIILKTLKPQFIPMLRFEALAREVHEPKSPRPGVVEFFSVSASDQALLGGLSPYINQSDLKHLAKANAICSLMRIDDEVAGLTFFSRGTLYVRELSREIYIGPHEFYGSRSYVSPKFRGRHVMAWMKYDFSKQIAAPMDRLWSLVQTQNEASIRSNISCGLRPCSNIWFISILGLGFKISRRRSASSWP